MGMDIGDLINMARQRAQQGSRGGGRLNGSQRAASVRNAAIDKGGLLSGGPARALGEADRAARVANAAINGPSGILPYVEAPIRTGYGFGGNGPAAYGSNPDGSLDRDTLDRILTSASENQIPQQEIDDYIRRRTMPNVGFNNALSSVKKSVGSAGDSIARQASRPRNSSGMNVLQKLPFLAMGINPDKAPEIGPRTKQ